MLILDFMTPNPVTIGPDTSHHEAVKLMRDKGFRRLPVVDKAGNLIGIVVEKDLLSTQPSPVTSLSIWEVHNLMSKLKVGDFMSSPVYTTRAECPIEDAATIMVRHRIGCLPVMEGERLVGIITETDIFKVLTKMMAGGEEGRAHCRAFATESGRCIGVGQVDLRLQRPHCQPGYAQRSRRPA